MSTAQRVALKVLRPHIVGDDEARARLAREVSSLTRVRSRWVAEIVDADPWGEIPFVATRYVPGLSLHDHVVEEGPITGQDLTWFATCLAEGVASVHAVGVLHRDVKPTNVLMEGRTPILIDFGLARVADDPKLTHTGWLLGTPGYLAPEILHGDEATPACDVHSWAATVAYAGTGRGPFGRGPSMAIMDRVRRGEHDLTGLPEELRVVVAAALQPDPARRPSLDQLLERLRPQVGAGHAISAAAGRDDDHDLTVPLALAGTAAWADHEATQRIPAVAEPATRRYVDDPPFDGFLASAEPVEEPVSFLERLRRAMLLLGLAAVAGAGIAAYPWLVLGLLFVVTWLVRSGSLAASAHGDRRRFRGRKWYDGPRVLIGAPWDLVRSIPSTLLLVLWSVGLAIAAALVCYAVAAGVGVSLFASGLVFGASLWMGPGGHRVRSPLARVVNPLAADGRRWAVAVVLLLAAAGGLSLRADLAGVDWSPAEQAPWTGIPAPTLPLGL